MCALPALIRFTQCSGTPISYLQGRVIEGLYAPNRFKILVIGRKGSGRSALVRRFKLNVFENKKDEIALPEITVIVRAIEGHITKADFEIMELSKFVPDDDPSSPPKVHNTNHRLDVNGVLLVYDITNMGSYKEMCRALPMLQRLLAPDVDMCFVGTKSDLKEAREVPFEDAEKKSQQLGFSLFETSAETGSNCEELLIEVLDKLFERRADAQEFYSQKLQVLQAKDLEITVAESVKPRFFCWLPHFWGQKG